MTSSKAFCNGSGSYTSVRPTTVYGQNDSTFGWDAALVSSGFFSQGALDHGPGSSADYNLLRDRHYGYDSEFLVDLPVGGTYIVNMVSGDTSPFYHDQVEVYAEGNLQTTVSTTAGQWTSSSFLVDSNAQLSVRLRDAGGVDPHWVLNALRVRPAPTLISIGGPAGPLDANGTTVDTFMGTGAPPGSLVTVATTLGTITSADLSATYQGVQVQAQTTSACAPAPWSDRIPGSECPYLARIG